MTWPSLCWTKAPNPLQFREVDFRANWKQPFVATELSEGLPHWEMAVYLLNPAKLAQSAHYTQTDFWDC